MSLVSIDKRRKTRSAYGFTVNFCLSDLSSFSPSLYCPRRTQWCCWQVMMMRCMPMSHLSTALSPKKGASAPAPHMLYKYCVERTSNVGSFTRAIGLYTCVENYSAQIGSMMCEISLCGMVHISHQGVLKYTLWYFYVKGEYSNRCPTLPIQLLAVYAYQHTSWGTCVQAHLTDSELCRTLLGYNGILSCRSHDI